MLEFLDHLKEETKDDFPIIMAAVTADVKFNKVNFGKIVTPNYFMKICCRCKKVICNA